VEREKRLNQAIITHPELNPNNKDLKKHICEFLSSKLSMSEREIDQNLEAVKSGREHSVIIKFSRKFFKGFIYAARSKLRKSNPERCDALFINDNLTHYNFSLLKLLKRERRTRCESRVNNFVSVFSLEGKVYVKTTYESEKQHIKNMDAYKRFLSSVDSNSEESSR